MWNRRKAGLPYETTAPNHCPNCGVKIAPRAKKCQTCATTERNQAGRQFTLDSFVVDAESGCWLWQGSRASKGYGSYWDGSRLIGAHIAVYEAHRGPVPPGLVLDHLCRTPLCVNPSHLDPVPQMINMQRGANAKIGPVEVAEIRRLAGTMHQRDIGAMFGLKQAQVSKIIRRQCWPNVD